VNYFFLGLFLFLFAHSSWAETTSVDVDIESGASACSAEQVRENQRIIRNCQNQWSSWGIERPPINELRTEHECPSRLEQSGNLLLGCASSVVAPFVFLGGMALAGALRVGTQGDTDSDQYIFREGSAEDIIRRLQENWLRERCGLGAINESAYMEQACPNALASERANDCNQALSELAQQRICRRSTATRQALRDMNPQFEAQRDNLIAEQAVRRQQQHQHQQSLQAIQNDCGTYLNPHRRLLLGSIALQAVSFSLDTLQTIQPNQNYVHAYNECVKSHPQTSPEILAEITRDGRGLIDSVVGQYQAFSCYNAQIRSELLCDIAMTLSGGGVVLGARAASRLGSRNNGSARAPARSPSTSGPWGASTFRVNSCLPSDCEIERFRFSALSFEHSASRHFVSEDLISRRLRSLEGHPDITRLHQRRREISDTLPLRQAEIERLNHRISNPSTDPRMIRRLERERRNLEREVNRLNQELSLNVGEARERVRTIMEGLASDNASTTLHLNVHPGQVVSQVMPSSGTQLRRVRRETNASLYEVNHPSGNYRMWVCRRPPCTVDGATINSPDEVLSFYPSCGDGARVLASVRQIEETLATGGPMQLNRLLSPAPCP
jgi:hypothetical protein